MNRRPPFRVMTAIVVAAAACGGSEPEGPDLVVETSSGLVEGAPVDDGRGPAGDVLAFRGIPYAAPPVGDLRWRPPEAPESWDGVRLAQESGAPCWQRISPDTSIWSRGELDRSEDCLYLDLWTAAAGDAGPRPVMVWFHGGSHEVGHGSSLIFDGAALARKGVVLVSINYRLGSFGFLAHAALTAESEHGSSGNYGLLDKIAALEWVRDNAAAFGGDQSRVTIFGQSAGSMSVCSLVASPLAAGLFHRAIGQSAGCFTPLEDLEQAERRGVLLADELGVAADGAAAEIAAAMRAASAEDVLAGSGSSGWSDGSKTVVDGWYLPDQPSAIYARGEHNRVPMMVGFMGDESRALFAPGPALRRPELERQLEEQYGEAGAGLLVTLCRRSPPAAAALLAQELSGSGAVLWDGRGENPYLGFLALADALVVTGDSVSMVSEAASTGKPVLIAALEGGSDKFTRFHESLRRAGITRPFAGRLEEWRYPPLAESARIAAEIRERLANRTEATTNH